MKWIAVIILAFSCYYGSAQEKGFEPDIDKLLRHRKQPPTTFQLFGKEYKSLRSENQVSPQVPVTEFSHSLPNGAKVYLVFGMPCVVPDMSQFNMPNVGLGIKPTGMPPGFMKPRRIIPRVIQ